MIPFASQRGNGQDLATHLSNEYDNEVVQLIEIRGSVAKDLHGAFKEWQLQAETLTKCQKYLYSLSINPDPAQPSLDRDQFMDYIRRTEEALGLSGQPRAIVFHTKFGREHCHVAWSRVDAANERAVHLAFDKEKLMTVTRDFARDHHLVLPPGYEKSKGTRQRTLYEQVQLEKTGLSQDDHKNAVTEAWRHSDGAPSFVQALAERGYILATGRRSYVVVDLYGNVNALPKLIDDKSVRTKDIRNFLEADYPTESLPSVEEAQKLVGQHRAVMDRHHRHQHHQDKVALVAELKETQEARRRSTELALEALHRQQKVERNEHQAKHRAERDVARGEFLADAELVRSRRARNKPSGLAGFLGKVSGVSLIRERVQRHHDAGRMREFQEQKVLLGSRQADERLAMESRFNLRRLEVQRQLKALTSIDKRELAALARHVLRDERTLARGHEGVMPSLENLMKDSTSSREAEPIDLLSKFEQATSGKASEPPNLLEAFERASKQGDEGEREEGGHASSLDAPEHGSSEDLSGPIPGRQPRRSKEKVRDR